MVQDLLEPGDRDRGRHEEHAVAAQGLLRQFGRHPAGPALGAPDAPHHGGRGQAAAPAVLGEAVEVGVGGGVGAVDGAAPHPGDGGEQHERVERVPIEEQVQVPGPADLGVEGVGELVRVGVGQWHQQPGPCGVEDGADPVAVLFEAVLELAQGLQVGDVARGQGDPGAEGGQFLGELRRTRRIRAAPADQHQVPGSPPGQPARDLRADPTGAAGDQHGAPGPPAAPRRGVAQGGPDQPPAVATGGPYGDLVLVPGAAGQHPAQLRGGVRVQDLREVDQTAPALRELQRGDPAQTPEQVLRGADRAPGVRAPDRHRTPGRPPQGRVDPGVSEGLHQGQVERGAQRNGGVRRVRALVEAQQRQHSRHRAGQRVEGRANPVGQHGTVGLRLGDP